MKRKVCFAALAMAVILPVAAQDTYESARLLGSDLNGTARYVGMGGAMDALGADLSTISTNPAGRMGIGLWGNPPEEDAARFMEVNQSSESPYVYISQWMENDPAVLWTKASGLFIPVLYNPGSLYIATVEETGA